MPAMRPIDFATSTYEPPFLKEWSYKGLTLTTLILKTQIFEGLTCIGGTSFWPISLEPTLKEHNFKALTSKKST